MNLTWLRETAHTQRAVVDGAEKQILVRDYGQNPALYEIVDTRNPVRWSVIQPGFATESAAKQAAVGALSARSPGTTS